jgi:hypothetical protein
MLVLEDPNPSVQARALELLDEHYTTYADLRHIWSAALNSKHPDLIRVAANNLSQRNPRAAIDAMLLIVQDHPRSAASIQALWTIAQLDPAHPILLARQELLWTAVSRGRTDERIASLAIEALSMFASFDALSTLRQHADNMHDHPTIQAKLREIIDHIQSQLSGERGTLSLVEASGATGGLELTNAGAHPTDTASNTTATQLKHTPPRRSTSTNASLAGQNKHDDWLDPPRRVNLMPPPAERSKKQSSAQEQDATNSPYSLPSRRQQ